MRGSRWCRVVLTAVGLVACGGEVPPEEHLGQSETALGVRNGTNLNGTNLNGTNLNGTELNDPPLAQMLVSVDYAGAWREGMFDAVWLEGSAFHGWYGGSHISGMDFVQTRFAGNLGDGSQVELRVDAVIPGLDVNQDVWTYRVSYRKPTDGQWYPICRDENGEPADAIAVAGRWDYRQGLPGVGGAKYDDPSTFTFACEGAAIAKCIRLGYKPWASAGGVSLAAHHQACTRLIRADYCGDGTSHTVDGQWVNLYDAVGVQQDTKNWGLEAEWDTEGARCVTDHNRAPAPVSCPGAPRKTQCGTEDAFSSGTLLQSETP